MIYYVNDGGRNIVAMLSFVKVLHMSSRQYGTHPASYGGQV